MNRPILRGEVQCPNIVHVTAQNLRPKLPKAAKLFRGLNAARTDGTWDKARRKLLPPAVSIIDDFGLSAMTMTQAEEFYEIVDERHQRGSIIMASNRPPGDWLSLLPIVECQIIRPWIGWPTGLITLP